MKFNRNKWWGKRGRFRRQVMALYGRVREEDNVLNMSVVFPVNLTIAILIGHIVSIVLMWENFGTEVIRNFILMLASVWAFYGIIVAARRTKALEKQVHIQEQGQVAERLARAAEQLSSKVMAVRILAIVSLRKIALGADMIMCADIIEILCAYAREKNKSPMQEDTRKAVIVLGHIKKNMKWNIYVDLYKINLSGAGLWNTNLSKFHLKESDLRNANLMNANLSGADLWGANLSGAKLWSADLSGANLSDANLSGANLWMTNLSEVKGLGTAKNLETVKWPPQEIIDEIARRKLREKVIDIMRLVAVRITRGVES